MSKTDLLLLDCQSEQAWGRQLQALLLSEKSLGARLQREPVIVYQSLAQLSASQLVRSFTTEQPSVALLVAAKPQLEAIREGLRALASNACAPALIVVTDESEPGELVALLELGVADFITPPLKASELIPRLWRLLAQQQPPAALLQKLKAELGLRQFVGASQSLRAVLDKIPRLANSSACVLIAGETGTGKEMCARAIHYLSPRAHCPFVPVNCGALPGELIENELFGHARGAYTDATRAYPGLIREAEGGSLFLDEVDSLALPAQVKFLRFLQDKEYRPLGASKTLKADVRIIAASNAKLADALRAGRLRQDLFYRLNVITLTLPPLRERREDIPLLARHFLKHYAAEFASPAADFAEPALQQLLSHDWPGNVRELENLIARCVALSEHALIEPDELDLPGVTPPSARANSLREAKAQFERNYIENLLLLHQGNITQAAATAHKDRRAFWELMRKHKIDAGRFRTAHNS